MNILPSSDKPHNSLMAGARWPWALIIVSSLICVWGAIAWPASFWPAGLVAVAFWTSISLGCLGLGLLHPVTGGLWGWGIKRELVAAQGTIPLTGLFILPFVFSAQWVFPWSHSLAQLNPHQQIYLSPSLVLTRTILECGLWVGLAVWLIRGHRQTFRDPAFRLSPRASAVGLILFWFSVTSMSVDGLMSLEPANNSSMFGAIEIIGCAVSGLAWILVMRCRRANQSDTDQQISHDLGNLLFAFNLIWAYLAFSQYLIVWAADLPHETRWYLSRQRGIAGMVGIALLIVHFLVPFVLLLSANLKRRPEQLAWIAGILLVARATVLSWTVLPACPGIDGRAAIGLMATLVLSGTLWVSLYHYWEARLPALDVLRVVSISDDSISASVEVTP